MEKRTEFVERFRVDPVTKKYIQILADKKNCRLNKMVETILKSIVEYDSEAIQDFMEYVKRSKEKK